ncbi:MAG: hypothetical protein HY000_08705 [Planctomycetes bacterium]|nr:hypothetical protein [Planctomycetota bacterium]
MNRFRFGLITLFGAVTFAALTFAALKYPTTLCARIVGSGTWIVLVLVSLWGVFRGSAFAGGFAIVGWAYALMSNAQVLPYRNLLTADVVLLPQDNLLTGELIEAVSGLLPEPEKRDTWLRLVQELDPQAAFWTFTAISHSIITLLLGVLGGWAAAYLHATREATPARQKM